MKAAHSILDDLLLAADRRGFERAKAEAVKMVDGQRSAMGPLEGGHEMLGILTDTLSGDIIWDSEDAP